MCVCECGDCVVEATHSGVNTSEASVMDRSGITGRGEDTENVSEDIDWRDDRFWGREEDLCRNMSPGKEMVE